MRQLLLYSDHFALTTTDDDLVSLTSKIPKTETSPTLKAKTVMTKEPMTDRMSQNTFLMQKRIGPNLKRKHY